MEGFTDGLTEYPCPPEHENFRHFYVKAAGATLEEALHLARTELLRQLDGCSNVWYRVVPQAREDHPFIGDVTQFIAAVRGCAW